MDESIRELHWRHRNMRQTRLPRDFEARKAIIDAFEGRAMDLQKAMPVRTGCVQAAGGVKGVHLIVREELHVERLIRKADALLCGETRLAGLTSTALPANCLACLEAAERISARQQGKGAGDGDV